VEVALEDVGTEPEHPFTLLPARGAAGATDVRLQRGLNRLCLPGPGEYLLRSGSSCYVYDEQQLRLSTDADEPLRIRPARLRVTGRLALPPSMHLTAAPTVRVRFSVFPLLLSFCVESVVLWFLRSAAHSSFECFRCMILTEDPFSWLGEGDETLQGTRLLSLSLSLSVLLAHERERTHRAAEEVVSARRVPGREGAEEYEYAVEAHAGERLRLAASSSEALFYPRHRDLFVEPDACPAPLPAFEARPGLYLKGRVQPALEALVKVFVDTQGEPVASVLTGPDGSFSVGPLHDDLRYRLVRCSVASGVV
jgi:hypothetical protein